MDITGFEKRYGGLAPTTMKAYLWSLKTLQERIAGNEPTDDEVRDYLRGLKSASYIHRSKAAIKRYYTYQNRVWPFDPREFSGAGKRLPQYLSREEVDKVLSYARNIHEYMFLKTLFMAGLRISELMGLTATNVLDDGLRIVGKRNKERIIPVVDEVFMKELSDWAFKYPERLFPYAYGEYAGLLKLLCQDAGVKVVSCHQIRHSRAMDLLNQGLSINAVQSFLGHENPSTTMIYLQLAQGDLKNAMATAGVQ